MEDETLVYCVPCQKQGIQTVLVKDVNWLPADYNRKQNGKLYPYKRCTTCKRESVKQALRKSRGYKGRVQRQRVGIDYKLRMAELGVPLCTVCWHDGVETVLIRDANWLPGQYKRNYRTCTVCYRQAATQGNRKRGRMPRTTDRSLLNDYYCYALIDEVGSTYYIGMGRGDRVNDHLKVTRAKLSGKRRGKRGMLLYTEKEKRIIRCLDSPAGYRYVKLATGLTQAQAFDAEAFWIEVYGQENLTNIAKPRARCKPAIPTFTPKKIPLSV